MQQIINIATRGYYFYSYQNFPKERRHKWLEIDERIIKCYGADKLYGQRYHNKVAGKVNYLYLRWENIALIMKTLGEESLPERLIAPFSDIRTRPLEIRPNDALQRENVESELVVEVGRKADKGFTLYLSNDCFRNIKYNLLEMVEKRQSGKVKSAFDMLNGIPAYRGIIEHKKQILKEVLHSAKKHRLPLKRADFRLTTKLKRYKVFADAETE